jgi:hypothetical protein
LPRSVRCTQQRRSFYFLICKRRLRTHPFPHHCYDRPPLYRYQFYHKEKDGLEVLATTIALFVVINPMQYGPDVEDAAKAIKKLISPYTTLGDVHTEQVSAAIDAKCNMGDEVGDEDFPDPLLRNAVEEQFAVSLSVRCVW